MWKTGVNVYKSEGGFLALYGGYIPTVAGVAPYVSSINCYYLPHTAANQFRSDLTL